MGYTDGCVWVLVLICSPFTFFYLLYGNYLSEL